MELQIKLKREEEDIKEVIIVLKDGRNINILPERCKLVDVYPSSDIFKIDISKNHLNSVYQLNRIIQFYDYHIGLSKKLVINMSYNNLSNNMFEEMLYILEKVRYKLCVLDLTHNNINVRGLEKLMSFLCSCPRFETLRFDMNWLTPKLFYETIEKSNLNKEIKERMQYKQF